MNNETSDNHDRQRQRETKRAGVLAAGVAAIALLAAACGSSSPAAGPAGFAASSGGSNYQRALAFAHCMRSHGEPGFPSPTREADNEVAFKIKPANGIDARSAQYHSAYRACQNLLPNGRTGLLPALRQQEMSTLLKHSECMRSHGIANYPDPVSNGKGISIPMSGVNPGSQQFQSARQACQSLMPGPGGTS